MKKIRSSKARLLSLAILAAGATIAAPVIAPQAIMAAETAATYDVCRYITFYYKNADGSTELASKGAYQLMRAPSETYEFTFDAAKASDFITGIPIGWKIENNDIPEVKASYENPPEEYIVYLVKDSSSASDNSGSTTESGKYNIVRKINFVYKNADGSASSAGSTSQTAIVYGPNVKYTFPEKKVSDFLEGDWSQWKPDRETIPSVTATYNNPPEDVTVYLIFNTDNYLAEKKTIERTVNYYILNEDGTKSSYGHYKDSIIFYAGNSKTKQYTFKDITVTPPAGYTADKNVVKGRTVTPESDSFTEEVVYTKRSDIKTEKKTVWRKVNFIDKATGKQIAGSQSQGAVFSRETYIENGKTVVVRDWQKEGTIKEFSVPKIDGYTAEQEKIPASKVTVDTKDFEVNVYYNKDNTGNLFKDVTDPNNIFFTPVYWAVDNGLATGYADNTFKPNILCSRGRAVTFLWKLAGRPKVTGTIQYKDVAKNSEFYDAILWAKAKGIVTGYGNNTFAPNQAVTRGQAVSMIWKYLGKPAYKTNKMFSDTPAATHLFYNAIRWAAENNIATGYAGYTSRMNDACTRGQIIRFIYNAVN